jgi:SAM-dependent methyltransferase
MNMNQWDQLTDIFGCKWNEDAIPGSLADNICIAWPSILKCIGKFFDKRTRLNVFDFGCGGGLFCRKLCEMGFDVTGYDESEELIKAARLNTPQEVTITNSSDIAAQRGKYDVITSIMVLQFISDINSTIENIVSILKSDGLIVYAVFNPKFIQENSVGNIFTDFTNNQAGYIELKRGIKIPVYSRSESEYRHLFEKLGYKEVYRDYPPFTNGFLDKYKVPFSTKNSEYLIQAFRRKTT